MTANDCLAFAVTVAEDRTPVYTEVRRRQIPIEAFNDTPLEIQSRRIVRFNHIQLLPGCVAHIADKNSSGERIASHAMGTAQPDGVKFLQRIRHADKWIVV